MSGWRPALRIARRELLRAKGRTLLVLLMVLLPVTAVVALSTLLRTADLSVEEGLPESLGSAQARLDVQGARVQQDPLVGNIAQYDQLPRPSTAQVAEALAPGSRLLELREDAPGAPLQVDGRRLRVTPVGIDLADPSTRGPFSILSGRAPADRTEVAVTRDLVDAGVAIGSTVDLGAGPLTVTGTVEPPRDFGASRGVYGLPEAVGLEDAPASRYWVSGPPVTWTDVQELNELGVLVLSRQVVTDPPDVATSPELTATDGSGVTFAIVGLIAVMAVLEVVLLAGPAFAVGARRQRRALALLAASGGEPAHVRRVVLAQGLLVGTVAAGVGVPLGLALAAAARAPLTRWANADWGPFDVSWLDVALIALLGAGTALLAALAPAVAMGRQPIVAALHGRRLTPAGAARPALLGLVLLGIGVALTVAALRRAGTFGGYAELGVAFAAVPTVVGAILLAPAALSALGRIAGRLPLPLRFAVRDADRQRGRTAPAVAAIAATVAGVVALGTASGSDAAQNRLDYTPSGPPGTAILTSYVPDPAWEDVRSAATAALPGEQVTTVRGLAPPTFDVRAEGGFTDLQVCRPTERPQDGRCFELHGNYANSYGSEVLVGADAVDLLAPRLGAGGAAAARAALDRGQVLISSANLTPGEPVELRLTHYAIGPDGGERAQVLEQVQATAVPLPVVGDVAPARAVLPESLARELAEPATVAVVVGSDLSREAESALRSAVRGVDDGVDVRVERGYDGEGERTALLVLGLVAGLLVLGGTLAATALALSEARPDLTTVGQVGARPRTRRAIAGAYALVLGAVGAVLGVAAGLIPGVAAAVPLTSSYGSTQVLGGAERSYVVDLPLGLLALVLVVLPVVSAAVAAATARSSADGPRRAVT